MRLCLTYDHNIITGLTINKKPFTFLNHILQFEYSHTGTGNQFTRIATGNKHHVYANNIKERFPDKFCLATGSGKFAWLFIGWHLFRMGVLDAANFIKHYHMHSL